jgi:hypothetical protein
MASPKPLASSGKIAVGTVALVGLLTPWFWFASASAQGIFSCVDKNGRTYLSDKRIPECLDVVHSELGKSGVAKRRLEPETYLSTAAAKGETVTGGDVAKERALREVRQQKALLERYPNEHTHVQERKRALLPVDESIRSISTQTNQHLLQRQALVQAQAGYKIKQVVVPSELQQKMNETDALLTLLNRQLSERNYERQRINQRFDTEINQLRRLWDPAGATNIK